MEIEFGISLLSARAVVGIIWSIVDITTSEILIQDGMSMMMSRATVLCGALVATSYVAAIRS